jgi:hypothetical protein
MIIDDFAVFALKMLSCRICDHDGGSFVGFTGSIERR